MNFNYRRSTIMVLCAAVAFVAGLMSPRAARSAIETNVKPDLSAEQLKIVVVEDFEDSSKVGSAEGWKISTVPAELKDKGDKNPVEILESKLVKGKPNDLKPEDYAANGKGTKDKFENCLGIHFQFKYPGYNSVHLEPPLVKLNGEKEKRRAIPLPGQAKAISLWFHGRGNDYKLETWVEDYRGNVHILKLGSVNFVGWRPLKTYIPINIPQKIDSYPQTKFLKIVRFVLRANPDEPANEIFMFFDQLKVLTDDFEVNFDGQKLDEAFKKGGDSGEKSGEKAGGK